MHCAVLKSNASASSTVPAFISPMVPEGGLQSRRALAPLAEARPAGSSIMEPVSQLNIYLPRIYIVRSAKRIARIE